MGALTFCVSFLMSFFLKLIVACRLCVIYVREDNDSIVKIMITRLIWTMWTSPSAVPRKAVNLIIYSLTGGAYSSPIICMRPANERWRYIIISCFIGRARTRNDPWYFRLCTQPALVQIMDKCWTGITWTNADLLCTRPFARRFQ